MTARGLLAGVDAGATTIRSAVGESSDRVLARAESPAVRLADGVGPLAALVARDVRAALSTAGAPDSARALVVGAAGAGAASAASALAGALATTGVAACHTVVTDVELVLADAFHDGPGIALIAGTGSIAMGRLPSGDVVRAGGHGPDTGDAGSGYAIGADAVRSALEEGDRSVRALVLTHLELNDPPALRAWLASARPAAVAALAPALLGAAASGAAPARRITDAAAHALAGLVAELVPRFAPGGIDVAVAGGLFKDAWFRSRVVDAVAAAAGQARVLEGEPDAVRGALWLAARLAALEPR